MLVCTINYHLSRLYARGHVSCWFAVFDVWIGWVRMACVDGCVGGSVAGLDLGLLYSKSRV